MAAILAVVAGRTAAQETTPAEPKPTTTGAEAKPAGDAKTQAQDAAQSAAEAWLKLLDAGNYNRTWNEGSKSFQNGITEGKWKEQVTAGFGPLGKLASRKIRSRKYTENLPGAPKGRYVVVEYDAAFEKKPETVETVFMMLDPDKVWRVTAYFVGPAR